MQLMELFDRPKPGYKSPEDDNTSLKLKDLRKTKLTLAHINRLRQMNDVRELEKSASIKQIQAQYAPKAGSDTGMM